MASSVVSITTSSQVPVISIQRSPLIFLALRMLLLCRRSSNGTRLPRCCRSAAAAPFPGSRRISGPGVCGAFPRRGRAARLAGVPQRGGMLSGLSLGRVGSSHASTGGGAALAAGTCPLRAASRRCSVLSRARCRHGFLDNLSPRGVSACGRGAGRCGSLRGAHPRWSLGGLGPERGSGGGVGAAPRDPAPWEGAAGGAGALAGGCGRRRAGPRGLLRLARGAAVRAAEPRPQTGMTPAPASRAECLPLLPGAVRAAARR